MPASEDEDMNSDEVDLPLPPILYHHPAVLLSYRTATNDNEQFNHIAPIKIITLDPTSSSSVPSSPSVNDELKD